MVAKDPCPPPPMRSDEDATVLCTSCGLCCEGALHGHAVLREEEVDHARALGLPVEVEPFLGFTLPCPKLVDRCCSIYGQRPRVCAGYRCQLLLDLDEDRTDLTAALDKVAVARALFDEFTLHRSTHPADPAEAARRRLHLTKLRYYLERNFLNPWDGPLLKQETVGAPHKEQD